MKTFLNIVTVIGVLGGNLLAFEPIDKGSLNITLESENSSAIKTKLKKIRDSGVERNLLLPTPKIDSNSINKEDNLKIKKGLIISFTSKNIDIESFATEFNLKLKERLKIGYYIFKNSSKLSDTSLINSILKWDRKSQIIKTIRPNWKMNKEYK